VHSPDASSKEAAMNLRLDAPLLTLEAGQLLSLDDACGTRIEPREGSVWITEEGEARDFVVGPGEAFLVTRRGLTLVQALHATRLALADDDLPCAANDAY
jgi:hypothetical protein